jgi:hypothetical protein
LATYSTLLKNLVRYRKVALGTTGRSCSDLLAAWDGLVADAAVTCSAPHIEHTGRVMSSKKVHTGHDQPPAGVVVTGAVGADATPGALEGAFSSGH